MLHTNVKAKILLKEMIEDDSCYCFIQKKWCAHQHTNTTQHLFYFVFACSWRLLLHDIPFTGPRVWWSSGDLFLFGNHLRWSHVHPGSHRAAPGKKHPTSVSVSTALLFCYCHHQGSACIRCISSPFILGCVFFFCHWQCQQTVRVRGR